MESLIIDFADRADIRAKLPAARKRLDELEAALREQAQEVEDWREYVAVLARRAELGPAPTASGAAAGSERVRPEDSADNSVPGRELPPPPRDVQPLDLVVEVINRENRKIRAKDVAEILRAEGHEIANMVVSNALFYGAKRAEPPRIKSAPGRGFYAPLSYSEPAMIAGSASAASNAQAHPTTPAQLGPSVAGESSTGDSGPP